MADLTELTQLLQARQDLTDPQAAAAARALTEADVPAAQKKAFLKALAAKGETVTEVVGFARTFRDLARPSKVAQFARRGIDIVGTGGSGSKGFNVSSTVAILLAAGGAMVLKHGNRAVTSQSGAADFLGLLGIPLTTHRDLMPLSAQELNFCFFFAPSYHPAFKEVMPVRKELAAEGVRTVFNVLGPLINPARPLYQLLGVFSEAWVRPLAEVQHALAYLGGLVVHSKLPSGAVMDELTTAGENVVRGFGDQVGVQATWLPEPFGIEPCPEEDLRGGTPEDNIALLYSMMAGRGPKGLVDTILLNAGAAYWILGEVSAVHKGMERARETLLGGDLADWLERARQFYLDHPEREE